MLHRLPGSFCFSTLKDPLVTVLDQWPRGFFSRSPSAFRGVRGGGAAHKGGIFPCPGCLGDPGPFFPRVMGARGTYPGTPGAGLLGGRLWERRFCWALWANIGTSSSQLGEKAQHLAIPGRARVRNPGKVPAGLGRIAECWGRGAGCGGPPRAGAPSRGASPTLQRGRGPPRAPASPGATRDIGSALTRMCMRHRSIETKLRQFTK